MTTENLVTENTDNKKIYPVLWYVPKRDYTGHQPTPFTPSGKFFLTDSDEKRQVVYGSDGYSDLANRIYAHPESWTAQEFSEKLENTFQLCVNQAHQLQKLREEIATLRANYEHDMRLIGETLDAQAREQDWCSAYEDILGEVNSNLKGGWFFDGRTKQYTVTVNVVSEFRWSQTFEVEAMDEEQAEESAKELFGEIDPDEHHIKTDMDWMSDANTEYDVQESDGY